MALIWTVLFVCLSLIAEISKAEDVFCGGLTVHKQQWLAKTVATISSQKTSDLKECLNICCSIPNCNAVTFMGFISNNSKETPSTNCLMFSCRENCVVVDRPSAAEGVVSVIINRAIPTSTTTLAAILPLTSDGTPEPIIENQPPEAIPVTFPRPPIGHPNLLFGSSTPPSAPDSANITSSTISSTHQFLTSYSPIWAVGVAIVIAVICIGLNVVLISAFCCYKRHKNRMRSENFTHVKAPTLHAFNPTT